MRCPWTHTAPTVLDHSLLETHFSTVSSFQVNACVATHIGDRQDQQDRVAIITSPRNPGALLAIVADGMGGRTGGRAGAQEEKGKGAHLPGHARNGSGGRTGGSSRDPPWQ